MDANKESTVDPLFFAQVQQLQKMADISELVQLMDETHKNRTWLLDEIKRKRQKIRLRPDMGGVAILRNCDTDFIANLIGQLKNQKLKEYDSPTPLSKTYHWFFTDIVSGSHPSLSTSEQARKIYVLNKIIGDTETFKQRNPENTLILPTGDGMAIGFADSPENPLKLALEVHEALYTYNQSSRSPNERISIRIGLDTGPVFSVQDLNGNENVWGPGIIMARRVMDLAKEMNILASSRFANDIKNLKPEYRQLLHPIGDYKIKHGEKLLIYNVYGDGFGNSKAPVDDKKQESKAEEELQQAQRRFYFNQVAVKLEVIDPDPSVMMTHHTISWNLTNISEKPIEKIFFYADGDVPRNFSDLNVEIRDDAHRELEIISLNANKPYHKEFFVKLRKPILPGEKGKTVFEYDWEEIDRQYTYTFATNAKRFTFLLLVPKGLDLEHKVVRVDTQTGDKFVVTRPASVKYLADKAEISWSANDIKLFQTYRFDW